MTQFPFSEHIPKIRSSRSQVWCKRIHIREFPHTRFLCGVRHNVSFIPAPVTQCQNGYIRNLKHKRDHFRWEHVCFLCCDHQIHLQHKTETRLSADNCLKPGFPVETLRIFLVPVAFLCYWNPLVWICETGHDVILRNNGFKVMIILKSGEADSIQIMQWWANSCINVIHGTISAESSLPPNNPSLSAMTLMRHCLIGDMAESRSAWLDVRVWVWRGLQ